MKDTKEPLERFIAFTRAEKWDFDTYQLADALWLWQQQQRFQSDVAIKPNNSDETEKGLESSQLSISDSKLNNYASNVTRSRSDSLPLTLENQDTSESLPISLPDTAFIRDTLELGRMARPIIRKISSASQRELDIELTVNNTAEYSLNKTSCLTIIPAYQASKVRSLDVILIVEEWASMMIWKEMVEEIRDWLEQLGAFRDIKLHRMAWKEIIKKKEKLGKIEISPYFDHLQTVSPESLIDPRGERLIIFFSDCTSPAWYEGRYNSVLKNWGTHQRVTLLSPFPEKLWDRTALGQGWRIQLQNELASRYSQQWNLKTLPDLLLIEYDDEKELDVFVQSCLRLPILSFTPHSLSAWAKVVDGHRLSACAGRLLEINPTVTSSSDLAPPIISPEVEPEKAIKLFANTASPLAWELIKKLSAVPINLAVIRVIQQELPDLRKSTSVDVAEVLLSGLLKPTTTFDFNTDLKSLKFEFVPRVRDILFKFLGEIHAIEIIDKLSVFIANKLNLTTKQFEARLLTDPRSFMGQDGELLVRNFAMMSAKLLSKLGGDYNHQAENFQALLFSPSLQEFEFETAQLEETETLQPFDYETANVKIQHKGKRRQPQVVIEKEQRQTWGYTEPLSETIALEMVEIPAGSFLMGSPENEPERRDSESPQQEVTVSTFFMGRYPVTQAQWRVVAALPQIERSLDPDPSEFKGDDRPVEQVSWLEAKEFCARLSQLSQKQYRLPTEAEWEYACRAGTITPFHSGETITPDLANYNWQESYNKIKVTKKKDFEGTTSVGSFPANSYGLYDMHGNVWEWCEDHWHDNYEGAPKDGAAWLDLEKKEPNYVLRGGSWHYDPRYCRSAPRDDSLAGFRYFNHGFRVVCAASRTL